MRHIAAPDFSEARPATAHALSIILAACSGDVERPEAAKSCRSLHSAATHSAATGSGRNFKASGKKLAAGSAHGEEIVCPCRSGAEASYTQPIGQGGRVGALWHMKCGEVSAGREGRMSWSVGSSGRTSNSREVRQQAMATRAERQRSQAVLARSHLHCTGTPWRSSEMTAEYSVAHNRSGLW